MKKEFGRKWLAGLIVAFMMAFALAQAAPAQATEYWKGKFVRFYATAGESLAIGDVVCMASYDSRAYKADADDAAKRFAVGVVGTAAATGASVEIVVSGIITGQTAASVGSKVYLSITAGAMTTTPDSSWGQVLGSVVEGTSTEVAAKESSTYFISVLPISASGLQNY